MRRPAGRGRHGHRVASISRPLSSLVLDGAASRKPRPGVGRRPAAMVDHRRRSGGGDLVRSTWDEPSRGPRDGPAESAGSGLLHEDGDRPRRRRVRRCVHSRRGIRHVVPLLHRGCWDARGPLFPTAHRKARMRSSIEMPQIDVCRMTKSPFITLRCRRIDRSIPLRFRCRDAWASTRITSPSAAGWFGLAG
jgi:hypothetical protein